MTREELEYAQTLLGWSARLDTDTMTPELARRLGSELAVYMALSPKDSEAPHPDEETDRVAA